MLNPGGRPPKYETVEELQALIDDYFNKTPDEELTITGLGLTVGLDRKQLINYAKKDKFSNTINRAKDKIHESYERSLKKRGNAGDIFALKNFGWSDKQEIDHNVKGELSLGQAFEALEKTRDEQD